MIYPRLKQSLGQNLLRDKNLAAKIARLMPVDAETRVVEVGPGDGALTDLLVERVRHLTAVEIDRRFAEALQARFAGNNRVTILHGDFLEADLGALLPDPGDQCRVVVTGNLPYHITSPCLFRVLAHRHCIASAVFMMQREVGERLTAPLRSKGRGILSVVCQYGAVVTRLVRVPPEAFVPRPRVESVVMRLDFREPDPRALDEQAFVGIVRAAFNQRRKLLSNSLAAWKERVDAVAQSPWDWHRRPEELTVAEFVQLANYITTTDSFTTETQGHRKLHF